jgi:hypothetical protein
MIKIPQRGSILNGLGSKFNTSGLNIQRWKMTHRVNFQPGSKYFVTPAVVTITGDRAANLDPCLAPRVFSNDSLIDWLFTVLRPAQEFFTYMETSP